MLRSISSADDPMAYATILQWLRPGDPSNEARFYQGAMNHIQWMPNENMPNDTMGVYYSGRGREPEINLNEDILNDDFYMNQYHDMMGWARTNAPRALNHELEHGYYDQVSEQYPYDTVGLTHGLTSWPGYDSPLFRFISWLNGWEDPHPRIYAGDDEQGVPRTSELDKDEMQRAYQRRLEDERMARDILNQMYFGEGDQ